MGCLLHLPGILARVTERFLSCCYIPEGQTGGMPQMVFEYILKKQGLDPASDLNIDQSIDFGSTAAAFSGGQGDYTVVEYKLLHLIYN